MLVVDFGVVEIEFFVVVDGVERGVERVERGFHDDGARGEGGVCARRRGVVFAGVANVGVLLWCGGGRFEGGDV